MKKLVKKLTAVVLVLCLMLTMIPMSVMSTCAAEVESTASVSNPFSAGAQTFGINKLYSTGLSFCGTALKQIAKASGDEGFQEFASFVNVWVFGGSNTGDQLNEISEMCSQILNEVKAIDEKLDVYTADIEEMLSKSDYNTLNEYRTNAWEKDVKDVLSGGSISNKNVSGAFDAFFNYQAIDPSYKTDHNAMSYLVAAMCYKNGEADKNGYTYTESDVEEFRDILFTEFCKIHGGVTGTSIEEQKKQLFEKKPSGYDSMDTIMQTTINELKNNLTKINYNSYADYCAQLAYAGITNLADQREYVIANLNQQFMVIVLTEMMYQEYLAMRGEYLEETYPDPDASDEIRKLYDDYYNDINGETNSLFSINKSVETAMENRISKEMCLSSSSGVYLSIGEYPTYEDLEGVTLYNSSYLNVFDSYVTEQPILDFYGYQGYLYEYGYDEYSSSASYTKAYMEFDKLPICTKNGVEMYYILVDKAGDKDSSDTHLVYCDYQFGLDYFIPSCDYFNLVRGSYTDGSNTFVCPSLPSDETSLFSTESYKLANSIPSQYLNQYYSDTGTKLYQLFSTYTYSQKSFGYDPHANYVVIDMNETAPSFNLSLSEQLTISAQDIHEGYDDFADGFYYTVILQNNAQTLSNTLSYSVTGMFGAEVMVLDSSENEISNGDYVTCGDSLTLKFKTENDYTDFTSLKLLRYNDTENPTVATSEETILEADDFEVLQQDDDGYYILDINMPYSNAELVFETDSEMDTDDDGNYVIRDYRDLLEMSEKVNAGTEGYIDGNYIVANDITFPDDVEWTDPIGSNSNNFKGTFNGQGYTISGIKGSDNVVGFFNKIYGATIQNVKLEDVSFTARNLNVGGLCVSANNSTITNCTVSGNITVSADSGCEPNSVAGVCANAYSSTIEKCINYCTVDAHAMSIGGVVAHSSGTVKDCANFGNIKGYKVYFDHMTTYPADCAGIVAENNGTVRNSYNAGVISGSSSNSSVVASGNAPVNCYYLDTCASDSNATAKSAESFSSGEVCYLLNKNTGITSWAWFQNLDNGETPDQYPTLKFSGNNAVFKVNREDATYSNIPNGYLLGDTDLDGKITIMDATVVQQHCAKLYTMTGVALVNANVVKDDIISVSDATKIQSYVAQLITEW